MNLNRLEPAVVEWLFRFTAPMGQSDTIAVDFEAGEIARVTLPLPASAPSRLYGLDVRRIEVGECSSFDLALELRPDAASILRLRVTTGGGCTLMVSEGGRDIVNVPERRTETFEFRCP